MGKPVLYLQTDSRWANKSYSAPGESTTIGKSGCGPTSAAMVVASWKDKTVTPVEACAWAVQKGYKAISNGTYHSFFKPYGAAYGLTITQITPGSVQSMTAANAKVYHDKALAAIKNGDLVICLMGKGNWTTSGHYILWYDYDGTNVYINDSASTKATRTKNTLKLLQSQVKHYWICTRPTGGEKFNDIASGTTTATTSSTTTAAATTATSKTVTAKEAAKSQDKALAGTYVVTASAGLHVRSGAGTAKASLAVLPKGTKVKNYGYYTTASGVKWLYIQATCNGVTYTGFSSIDYLKKQ